MKKVVIIGGGPGGYHTALYLAKAGYQITVIEKDHIGGTCLNVGCIPSKTLLDTASLFEHFSSLTNSEVFLNSNPSFNLLGLQKMQTKVINELQQGLYKLIKKSKINFLSGEAVLLSDKKVQIKSKENNVEIEADEIVLATGSSPKTISGFEFDERLIVSSDDIWNIPVVKEKLLIIGSGPIGIEFARIYNTLGTKVTIVEIKEKICPILDCEISENLSRSLKKRGIQLKPNFATKIINKDKDKVVVELINIATGQREQNEFDQVLVAVGRTPSINNLNLESVGIEREENGFIRVNKYLQTNKTNIWAIGDITNFLQLAHTASFQARVVAKNIMSGKNGKIQEFHSEYIPSCIFGYPEIAFVGMTEEILKEKNISYKVGKSLFLTNGKAKASGLTEGIAKVLVEDKTNKIFGAHIIGAGASDLIHELVVAMQNNLTASDVIKSIHAHPTYSEAVLDALENCLGESVYN